MYFRLAESLGMTVGELLGRMSSAELTEWIAEFKLRAWEAERERSKPKPARRGRGR